jgi:hypothetical protein
MMQNLFGIAVFLRDMTTISTKKIKRLRRGRQRRDDELLGFMVGRVVHRMWRWHNNDAHLMAYSKLHK